MLVHIYRYTWYAHIIIYKALLTAIRFRNHWAFNPRQQWAAARTCLSTKETEKTWSGGGGGLEKKRKVSRINSRLLEWFKLYEWVCVCCKVVKFLFIIDYWKGKERKEVFYNINKYIRTKAKIRRLTSGVPFVAGELYAVYAYYTYRPETRARLGSKYSDINIPKAKSSSSRRTYILYWMLLSTTFHYTRATTMTIITITVIIMMTILYYNVRCTKKWTYPPQQESSDRSH